ncbi:hypothetical protein [Rhizobium cremeum]|uniref:hypothetical protein n=1 Tax=Rhizobium cremeum TaxID=2813827 RepID=UPI0013B001B2
MMMSNAALFGAVLGLAVAIFANLVVFPWVARAREKRFAEFYSAMPADKSLARRKWSLLALKLQYRVVMPLLFAGIGYMFGNKLLGAN